MPGPLDVGSSRRKPPPLRLEPPRRKSIFFFQAEDGIRDPKRDWSSDVCSSDLFSGLKHSHVQSVLKSALASPLVEVVGIAEDHAVYREPVEQALGVEVRYADHRQLLERSEERRVGKECRSRWWPYQ